MKKIILAFIMVLLFPLVVFAKVDTDAIMKEIAPDLKNATFKMKKPTTPEEGDFDVTGYVANLLGGDYFLYASCQEPYTTCTVTFQSKDYESEWEGDEEVVTSGWKKDYVLNVTFDEPEPNESITNYKKQLNTLDWADPSSFYIVEDLSLINYYLTGSKSELWNVGAAGRALKFSTLNKLTKGADITYYIDIRAGSQDKDLMYESAIGPMSIFYNGYSYGTKDEGVYLRRVIYVPESTSDNKEAFVKAAQERINEYLGNSEVTITYGGTLEELRQAYIETEVARYDAMGWVEGDDYSIEDLDVEDPEFPVESDGNYYLVKIGDRTYNFYIVKGAEDKLQAPVYNAVNLKSNIEVSSDDASIPLDSTIMVSDVNDGTIESKVGTENFRAYDLKVYSDAKEADIKELENGKFLVRIPVPEELLDMEELTIWYIPTSGEKEEHQVTVKEVDGVKYAEFETNHFSTYVLAEAKEEEEPKFKVEYDFNGGTNKDGKGKVETEQVAYAPAITKENFIDEMGVTPPEGYLLDAIEINGVRTELGEDYMLNKDTVYKYLWKAIETEEEPQEEETTPEDTKEEEDKKDNPQTGDNIIIYVTVLVVSILALVSVTILKHKYNK